LKILLYGINYAPELVGIGKYTGEMGAWLTMQGHEVRVITAPPYYPAWRVWSKFSKWFYSRSLESSATIWRCPLYVPSRPNSLLRILHLVSFALTSLPILIVQVVWKPNVVFLISPTLFCAPGALLLARLTGAISVLHIQDFEVDALFGLNQISLKSRTSIFEKIAFSFESLVLRGFNVVSTISSGMMQRASDKGVTFTKLRFLPNWSDITRFQKIEIDQSLLNRLGVPVNKKVILYSGNMGEKQGLENLVLAAQKLQIEEDLVFLLVGEGVSRNRLIKMTIDLKLDNIFFAPLQSYEDLPALLSSVDVHLVIQKRGVADVLLPSKLTNILAVGGNVVITADPSTTLGRLAVDHLGIALIVEPESVNALVGGIEKALNMPRPNHIAQAYAKKFLDKEEILSQFFGDIELTLQ